MLNKDSITAIWREEARRGLQELQLWDSPEFREIGERLQRLKDSPVFLQLREWHQRAEASPQYQEMRERFRLTEAFIQQLLNRRDRQDRPKKRTRPPIEILHLQEAIERLFAEPRIESPTAEAGRLIEILNDEYAVKVPDSQEKTVIRRIAAARKGMQRHSR
jgi:hypothetical protein